MLAIHPEIQEQVVDELHSVFKDKWSDVGRAELERLSLLERCINEALRLFPIVTVMARKCESSFMLRDYKIEPNMSVAIGVQQLHRNPRYWGPNSHEYNPDNFLPKNVDARNPYCFIPFSAGPRNCIGKEIKCHYKNKYSMQDILFVDRCQICNDCNETVIGTYIAALSCHNTFKTRRIGSSNGCKYIFNKWPHDASSSS